jgi:hypothetical protein
MVREVSKSPSDYSILKSMTVISFLYGGESNRGLPFSMNELKVSLL